MNFLTKIKNLLQNFMNTKDQSINLESAEAELNAQKIKIKDALTQLYFQQGKLVEKKEYLQNEATELAGDLELAVKENRNDLAMHLLEKTDDLKEQITFINNHLEQVDKDIALAKETQRELDLGTVKFKSSIESLEVRKNLLEGQKIIKEQLGSIRGDISKNAISKLGEQVHLLNAQIKTLETASPYENDLQKLRKQNQNQSRMQRLEELKRKHFNNNVIIVR